MFDTRYHWQVVSTRWQAPTVHQSLSCGMRYILHYATWSWSRGQHFPYLKYYWLDGVKNHKSDPLPKRCSNAVYLSQWPNIGGWRPSIGFNGTWKWLRNEERGGRILLRRMLMVHNYLEMWLGTHSPSAIQRTFRVQNNQMTAVEYRSDTEQIVKAPLTFFSYDGVAAFPLFQRSP
jgi:hypothetical protein